MPQRMEHMHILAKGTAFFQFSINLARIRRISNEKTRTFKYLSYLPRHANSYLVRRLLFLLSYASL
jgi:hypothetical protein